jgi:hypothetical protein
MRILQLSTLVAFLLMGLSSNAQKTTKEPVVQITGVCLVSDSLFPAPYVSVIRGKDRRGTYSNRDGYFTIPAVSGDTLVFICTGLETTFFVVPETEEHQLQVVTKMEIAPKELSPLYICLIPPRMNSNKKYLLWTCPAMDIKNLKETMFLWLNTMGWLTFPTLHIAKQKKFFKPDTTMVLCLEETSFQQKHGINS